MDITNPQVANKTLLSPKDIEAIQDDPAKMEIVARAMGAVNLDNLFRRMQDPNVPAPVKIEFQKMLNKMGKLEPETKGGNTNAQVVINITRARDREDEFIIEQEQTAPVLEQA